jgi:predicted MPP superfamily phosphohydrolase
MTRWRCGGIEQYTSRECTDLAARWPLAERFSVTQERIWLDPLPGFFSGLRIAQLSDIHHGLFLPKDWLAEAVQRTNRLDPDIVALTGDFVTYSKSHIEPAA